MWLTIRMIVLYPAFAMLAKEGLILFDPEMGTITIEIENMKALVMGVVGYAGTFVGSRWAKVKGGLT